MAGGRPTEYTKEIAQQAWDYLETYASAHKHSIPSIVGLAVVLKRAEATLYNWDNEEHPEFLGILAAIKEKQQLVLLNSGLDGSFSAPITKLVLGKHGYHDSQKLEANINDYSSLSDDDRKRKLLEVKQQLEAAERS
jgi:hypothetical protein